MYSRRGPQSVNERIASEVAALKSQIDPQTNKPYTIPAIAKLLGYSVDVTYKAWSIARQRAGESASPPTAVAGAAA